MRKRERHDPLDLGRPLPGLRVNGRGFLGARHVKVAVDHARDGVGAHGDQRSAAQPVGSRHVDLVGTGEPEPAMLVCKVARHVALQVAWRERVGPGIVETPPSEVRPRETPGANVRWCRDRVTEPRQGTRWGYSHPCGREVRAAGILSDVANSNERKPRGLHCHDTYLQSRLHRALNAVPAGHQDARGRDKRSAEEGDDLPAAQREQREEKVAQKDGRRWHGRRRIAELSPSTVSGAASAAESKTWLGPTGVYRPSRVPRLRSDGPSWPPKLCMRWESPLSHRTRARRRGRLILPTLHRA